MQYRVILVNDREEVGPSRTTVSDSMLSLSQTSYGWLLTENQAIVLWDEGSL
jgi:hypothetical protein